MCPRGIKKRHNCPDYIHHRENKIMEAPRVICSDTVAQVKKKVWTKVRKKRDQETRKQLEMTNCRFSSIDSAKILGRQ